MTSETDCQMNFLVSDEDKRKISLLKGVLDEHAQLPSRKEVQEVGLDALVTKLTDVAVAALGVSGTSSERPEERILFSSFSNRKRVRVSFEDFRPDMNGDSSWFKVTLVSPESEATVFFHLIKKFIFKGLNINELLVLDNLVSQKWEKMTPEEQVLMTLVLSIAFAAASGAKSFVSVSKPLRKLLSVSTLTGLLDITARRFTLAILDNLEKVVKAPKHLTLVFDAKKVPPKKFPPEKHIAKGYTDGLGKRSDAESLKELTPDEVLPEPDKNPPDLLMSTITTIVRALPAILR